MVYFDKTFKTDEEAEAFIVAYCQGYHQAGYGTSCRKVKQEDGTIKVYVSRGSSCD